MISRFANCIPVYNNPQTILDVIEMTLNESPYPLIVVDDGSDIPVEELYLGKSRQRDAKREGRLHFVRHEVNGGKGLALQTAFKTAVALGFTHLVTFDGDGQHDPRDIHKLIDCAIQNPWALVVGDRDMQTEHVPGSSTFGKKFSNFWVRFQTSVGVSDSQSGYRLYPLFHVQNMKFYCARYDFEIEVLIRLIWKNVPVKNVRVKVKYFPGEARVTHFHKFKDNLRITLLHMGLTVVSMLREQTSPFKSALAVGLGVFVGCTPLFGLHTLIIAGLAFLCRLNFVYLWVGTNISLPPFLPLLLIGAHYLGQATLLALPVSTSNEGLALIIGSLVLGLILGVLSFFMVYAIKRKNNNGPRKKAWTGRNRNQWGTMLLERIMRSAGIRPTYFLLRFISFYYFLFSFRSRKSMSEYWKVIRPDLGFWGRQLQMYRQIHVFAQTLVDRGLQRMQDPRKGLYFQYSLDSSSDPFVSEISQDARGTVIVASHIGGWDMAIRFFSQLSTDKKIMAVMYGFSGQHQHHSVDGSSSQVEIIHFNENENTILRMKDHLAQGQVVSVMGDRPVSRSCELMPFFGKLALFDTTSIRLAMACKARIHYVFSLKEDLKSYRVFTFSPELPPSPLESKDEEIRHFLKSYIGYLEMIVKRSPEQWFNFFPFWSETSVEMLD